MAGSVNNEILNIKTNADTGDLDRIERQLHETSDRLSAFQGAGNDAEQGADAAEGGFRKLLATAADLSLVGIGLKGTFDVLGGIFQNTLGSVFDQQKAFNLLEAQTGATADEMAMFEEQAKDIFTNNWGESMEDVVTSMSQVERVTHATGDVLEGLTQDAIALRDVFGSDVRESITAADNMMNTFGITGEEAFDLLTAGFQETGDPGGDLLEVFTEYSPAFKKMGFSAKQAMNLLNQGLKAGARNTEFVADGLREFNTRLSDGSSKEALATLGLSNMFDQFQRGEIDAAAVLEGVTQALAGVENEAQRAAIGAQIFGSKFEDMPDVFASLDLTSMTDAFQDVTMASENMANSMQNGLAPAWERLKRAGSQALTDALTPFVTMLADKAVPIIEKIVPMIEFFGERLQWAFGMGRAEGIFEIKKILDELGLGTLAPLVDITASAVDMFGRFFNAFKEGGVGGVLDQAVEELKNAAPVLFTMAKNLMKDHVITPMWEALKDRNNWIMAGNFARILMGELLGFGWNALDWAWKHITIPLWNAIIDRNNWIAASEFARKLLGEILGKQWNALSWARDNIALPLLAELGKPENWQNAQDFARHLMGSIMGAFWDAGEWVRNNIIVPIQNKINELMPSISIPQINLGPLGSIGGGNSNNVVFGAGAAAGGQMVTAVRGGSSNNRYNANYAGPRSTVLRDSGGWGVPGQPYGIGRPETYIPSTPGNFVPLDNLMGGSMKIAPSPVYLDGREIAKIVWQQEDRQYPGGRRH